MLIDIPLFLAIKKEKNIVIPVTTHHYMAAVAQLVRALACDAGCRGFESPQPPHNWTHSVSFFV